MRKVLMLHGFVTSVVVSTCDSKLIIYICRFYRNASIMKEIVSAPLVDRHDCSLQYDRLIDEGDLPSLRRECGVR